jgi:hypothetical protein
MATKGALSSLPKLTPAYGLEEGEKDDAVERATQRVMQAYSARQNLGYDPTLMAFSQGLLSSRGNFAEGLGAGLKGAQEAQQRTRDMDIEEAQAGLTMAQAQREQQNAMRSQGAFMSTIGGGAPKPAAGLPSSEAGQPAPFGAASGQPAGTPVTIDSALKYAATFPAAKDNARLLMEAAKAGLDRYLISQNGTVFDKMSGKYLPQDIPGQAQTEYNTPFGKYRMSANEYSRLNAAMDRGLGKEWMQAFTSGSTKPVDDVVSGTSTKPLELVTSTDGKQPKRLSESEAEVQSELRKSATGQEAARRKAIVDNADDADSSIELAQQFRSFADDPDAKFYQGILSNNTVMSGIIKLAQSGIGVPGFSIGIPEIETVVKNLNLKSPEAQAKAQVYAMLIAQMQLSKTKYMKGSVSNYEQGLMGRAGVGPDDTPDSVRAKADMLERRGTFDKDVARLYQKVGGNVSDFKQTDDYKKLKDQYIEDLKSLATGLKRIPSTSLAKPTEKGKRDNASAAEKLD